MTQGSPAKAGSLGTSKVVFFVIAAAAPLTGTLGALPIAIAMGCGAGTALAFVVAGAILSIFSVGFCRMSREMRSAGAFYAYIAEGLGAALGSGAAFVAVFSYTAIQIALFGLFGFFCKEILPSAAGADLPWWVFAIAVLALSHALSSRQVEFGASVLGILMLLEMGIILLVVAAVVVHGGVQSGGLVPFSPSWVADPGFAISLMFALACFVGFEATAIYAPEARDPERTIPRATYLSVATISAFFAVACWGIAAAYGPAQLQGRALADPGTLWFDAAQTYLGPVAVLGMQAFLLSSIFASIAAFHSTLSRYYQTMAIKQRLLRPLARCDAATGSPIAACRFQTFVGMVSIAVAAALGVDPFAEVFGWMSALATLGILLLQILVCAAAIRYFARQRRVAGHAALQEAWPTIIAPAIALAGLLTVFAFMTENLPLLAGTQSPVLFVLPVIQLVVLGFGAALYAIGLRTPLPTAPA